MEQAKKDGAKLVLDGRDAAVHGFPEGNWVGPTVFEGVVLEMIASAARRSSGPWRASTARRRLDEAVALMHENEYGNATLHLHHQREAAREFRYRAGISMIGVNIGVAAPMALFPFGGSRGSFYGDLKAQGRDAIEFYTDAASSSRAGEPCHSPRSRSAMSEHDPRLRSGPSAGQREYLFPAVQAHIPEPLVIAEGKGVTGPDADGQRVPGPVRRHPHHVRGPLPPAHRGARAPSRWSRLGHVSTLYATEVQVEAARRLAEHRPGRAEADVLHQLGHRGHGDRV